MEFEFQVGERDVGDLQTDWSTTVSFSWERNREDEAIIISSLNVIDGRAHWSKSSKIVKVEFMMGHSQFSSWLEIKFPLI